MLTSLVRPKAMLTQVCYTRQAFTGMCVQGSRKELMEGILKADKKLAKKEKKEKREKKEKKKKKKKDKKKDKGPTRLSNWAKGSESEGAQHTIHV